MSKQLEELLFSSVFGENQKYIEELYYSYLDNPDSVDVSWQELFKDYSNKEDININSNLYNFKNNSKNINSKNSFVSNDSNEIKAYNLVNTYRSYGHLIANIDPLNVWNRNEKIAFNLIDFELKPDDKLNTSFTVFGSNKFTSKELIDKLQISYTGKIGYEFNHITDLAIRNWFIEQIELGRNNISNDRKIKFLENIISAEKLEVMLGVKYPGAKRFSIEGNESYIGLVKEIIDYSANNTSINDIAIGMAHRGRLNTLVNICGKNPKELIDAFAGKHEDGLKNYSYDVKYHAGYSSLLKIKDKEVSLRLAYNPSHLEIISPVLLGSVKARQDFNDIKYAEQSLPILVHGDSAITGQGVVQETLNMANTRGYGVKGSIHIVINNQVGFTTNKLCDMRSSIYCTDIAKFIDCPIIHVNAESAEDVIWAAELSVKFRQKFNKDIFIDLIGYRKYGHNEADDPTITQPLMYSTIRKLTTFPQLYAEQLIKENVLTKKDVKRIEDSYESKLVNGDVTVIEYIKSKNSSRKWDSNFARQGSYDSKEKLETLFELALKINSLPENIKVHSRIKAIYNDRLSMSVGSKPIDWGMAENLAYANILSKKFNIRISGEDVGRGTFFHRHAVIHNQENGKEYLPLRELAKINNVRFNIWDSTLSEESILAFEYGYSIASPKTLTIWEAQFGDFANGAQVVIDQFISACEQKWGILSNLTLLLPHGYEGQGPEHSSARLERYLQLCSQDNIQVACPTTPSQIYHLLNRQAMASVNKPLIIMSPKSLLRNPEAVSTREELANGQFLSVINDVDIDKDQIVRIILCSGKVYYDLAKKRKDDNNRNIAIIRVEELYPWPKEQLELILQQYKNIKEIMWVQEEPKNQGAWSFVLPKLLDISINKYVVKYTGRNSSASTACGYPDRHLRELKDLLNNAFAFK